MGGAGMSQRLYKGVRSFSIEDALAIQAQHLVEWRPRLSARCWIALKRHAIRRNEQGYKSAHEVFRGQDIASFVANWQE